MLCSDTAAAVASCCCRCSLHFSLTRCGSYRSWGRSKLGVFVSGGGYDQSVPDFKREELSKRLISVFFITRQLIVE